jgi:hypothetical protein
MLAVIPVNEMAETLRVLAGANAGNAARHFSKVSFDSDDVASAILWTNIAETIERTPSAAAAPADEHEMRPVPRRMKHQLEATAFQDARFDDVDGDVLILEALEETLAAEREHFVGDARRAPERPQPLLSLVDKTDGSDQPEAWRLPLAA